MSVTARQLQLTERRRGMHAVEISSATEGTVLPAIGVLVCVDELSLLWCQRG